MKTKIEAPEGEPFIDMEREFDAPAGSSTGPTSTRSW